MKAENDGKYHERRTFGLTFSGTASYGRRDTLHTHFVMTALYLHSVIDG